MTVPLFTGPSEASALRAYLNELVLAINVFSEMFFILENDAAPTEQFAIFQETSFSEGALSQSVVRSELPGSHTVVHAADALQVRPVGSGANGPARADYGNYISIIKQDWLTSIVPGEIDGLAIAVRQGGPDASGSSDDRSDAGAILANVANLGQCGFIAAMEASSSNIARVTFLTTLSIQTQIGAINTDTDGQQGYGFVATATAGDGTDAYLAQNSGAGTWDYLFRGIKSGVGTTFSVTPEGKVTAAGGVRATLPTSAAGLSAGDFWNDGGTVKVVT